MKRILTLFAILLIAHLPLPNENGFWINTLLQVSMILGIAGVLAAIKRRRPGHRLPRAVGRLHPAPV